LSHRLSLQLVCLYNKNRGKDSGSLGALSPAA
jgi:hypothetical protein